MMQPFKKPMEVIRLPEDGGISPLSVLKIMYGRVIKRIEMKMGGAGETKKEER